MDSISVASATFGAAVQSEKLADKKLPRLGQLSFINTLPVALPVLNHLVDVQAEVVVGTPTELNRQYANGQLDIGAMSSFHYLSSGNLLLVPSISISAEGPVGSVLLFSKIPYDKLHGAKIAMTATSASSCNLLKVLCFDRSLKPTFAVVANPDIESTDCDAVLVIGDQALAVDEAWSAKYHRYDLAEWWHTSYGLPFVFGLWAARGEWARANFGAFRQISTALVQAKQIGLSSAIDDVLNEAHLKSGLTIERLKHYYLSELNFDFVDKHMQGLSQYARLCKQYGLI